MAKSHTTVPPENISYKAVSHSQTRPYRACHPPSNAQAIDYFPSFRKVPPSRGGGVVCFFPDLPGCAALGDTVDSALAEARSAAETWLQIADSKNIPRPIPTFGTTDDSRNKPSAGLIRIKVGLTLESELKAEADYIKTTLPSFVDSLIHTYLNPSPVDDLLFELMEDSGSDKSDKDAERSIKSNHSQPLKGSWVQRLPPNTYNALNHMANTAGITVNLLINQIIAVQFDRYKSGSKLWHRPRVRSSRR